MLETRLPTSIGARMERGDRAFVPPGCPQKMDEIDVETAQFVLIVRPFGDKRMEIFAFFDNTEGQKTLGMIQTETLNVPMDSALARIAVACFANSACREKLRQELLKNIKDCKRPCVALNKEGLEKALLRVG